MPNSLLAAMSQGSPIAAPGPGTMPQPPQASAPGAPMPSPGASSPAPGPMAAGGGGSAPGGPQKTTTVAELKEAIKKQSVIDNRLQNLLASGKPVERKAAVSMCVSLVADHVFSAEQMAQYMADMPQDPGQVRDWLAMHAQNAEQNLTKMVQMAHGQEAPPEVAAMLGAQGGQQQPTNPSMMGAAGGQ